MNKRQSILAFSTVFALALPGLAAAESPTNEPSQVAQSTSATTRADVRKELTAFRDAGVSSDGLYRWVGGEILWEPIAHQYSVRSGKLQHVDYAPLDNAPRAQDDRRDERLARELYFPA